MYEHVEAHQDDHDAHMKLSRVAQLNYCMDIDAKRELWELVSQMTLPLESVVVMTSGSEESIVYWRNKILAHRILVHNSMRCTKP